MKLICYRFALTSHKNPIGTLRSTVLLDDFGFQRIFRIHDFLLFELFLYSFQFYVFS